ncbi:unnamed protein product [Lactuca virosa]|uniref:Protein FAR1-RELATED SEQUENCE n=1 Tax=Lactuca virosa TaxID=75947 RepID=A0AAU9NAF0_9ASTR|nr:unnamed protein product [Lactuca virosa]
MIKTQPSHTLTLSTTHFSPKSRWGFPAPRFFIRFKVGFLSLVQSTISQFRFASVCVYHCVCMLKKMNTKNGFGVGGQRIRKRPRFIPASFYVDVSPTNFLLESPDVRSTHPGGFILHPDSGDRQMSIRRGLGSDGDQHVIDYLKRMQTENPSFFYAIQCDGEQSNRNIFWVDSSFRMNYSYFGDTVRLNTSYVAHQFRVPLISITGLNHHGQPVLFGCGLLHYESDSSYIWLLQNWLHAMSENHPVSITTEPNHHIQMAVSQVLPQTHHRFCKWSIFRETQQKLSHIYQTRPSFDKDFGNCIHETEKVEEFESCWQSLLKKYSLINNEWLQSIYNARHQWVPVYLQDTFFGELYTKIPEQTLNLFFDGYMDATTSIQSVIKQYEAAISYWNEMELKADFETTNTMPLLKTPSPMEKQAANLYTRRAFLKFQEELVETLANPATKLEDNGAFTTFQVAKFGEEQKHQKGYIVRFNSFEMKANCSCHMFEFLGIICRHVLSVFRAKNVLTLPSQYILKRWTRDAKRGGEIVVYGQESPNDSCGNSLNARYNSLRHEAIKYVEEGAKSISVYNVALEALQVASKKVSASKRQSVMMNNGVVLNGEMDLGNGSQEIAYRSRGEKEKKIRELSAELEDTNKKCEVYRANLLAVLKDMEEQKLKLSVKVQNARLSLKE